MIAADAEPLNEPVSKWVIYAAFSPDGEPTPHAAEQLADYRGLGFESLVIDKSPMLTAARVADWQRLASAWFQRPNVGYDFTSYREGIEHLAKRPSVDLGSTALLLTNDSCYGPFLPLRDVFARLLTSGTSPGAVWAITDSYEFNHHLQSYWLYFPPSAVPVAIEFFETMRPLKGLHDAITHGELALSRFLRERGCTLRALAPTAEVVARYAKFRGVVWSLIELGLRRVLKRPKYNHETDAACLRYLLRRPEPFARFNPTLGLGVQMVLAGWSPFLKRRLLRDNPYADRSVPECLASTELCNSDVIRILGGWPESRTVARSWGVGE